MLLSTMPFEEILANIGRAGPRVSGSTAALLAAQLGIAMAKMAFAVSAKHNHRSGQNATAANSIEEAVSVILLDAIADDIATMTERDRLAAAAFIDASLPDEDGQAIPLLIAATREPLAAAHFLVELIEWLQCNAINIDAEVASDYRGGAEIIAAAFNAVMMTVELNLAADGMEGFCAQTEMERRRLSARKAAAMGKLTA